LFELGIDVPRIAVIEFGLHLTHLGHQRIEVGVRVGHGHAELLHSGLQPFDVGHSLLHVLEDGLAFGQRWLLEQDADARVLGQVCITVVGLLQAGHDFEQGRLPRAVRTDDADLGARKKRQGDVVEHDFVAERLANVVHRIDELRHA
jgi:hypothetical protein